MFYRVVGFLWSLLIIFFSHTVFICLHTFQCTLYSLQYLLCFPFPSLSVTCFFFRYVWNMLVHRVWIIGF
uniref:Putative ovule protein n=1 Tax=Solanum chacoense TaxID=4108 RepID=A0A0V0GUG0_SOLCH